MGEYALSGALLTALAVIMAVLAFWRMENPGALRAARWGMGLMAAFLSAASAALLLALVGDDFTVAYVVEHSERALPTGYKIAAFWAAQGGGLLLWAWAMGVMGVIMTIRLRKKEDLEAGASLAVMAAIIGFFVAVILFAGSKDSPANPLEAYVGEAVSNGFGLNPALQNVAMVVHPPTLFLGYAGFASPFALLMGALMVGNLGPSAALRGGRGFEVLGVKGKAGSGQATAAVPAYEWLKEARPWVVWSWITLTIGIVLGCWWAYTELGWGGYWAWDPVENASVFPWLLGTALLHSAVMQTKRGSFKGWVAVLTVLSFLLCIFGTYLTRSGIKSVHSFAASDIPMFFLWMMAVVLIGSTLLLVARRNLLRSAQPLEDLVSREGFFLLANVLLVTMTFVMVIATALPLIMQTVGYTEPVEVKQTFYNKVILPMALLLAGLMATGPVLGHGAGAAGRAKKQLGLMAGVAIVAAVVTAALGYSMLWAMGSAAVVAGVVTGVLIDFWGALKARQNTGEGAAEAGAKVLTRGLRHWGAQVAHLGMAALVAGIAGSSLYKWQHEYLAMEVGKPQTFEAVTVTYHGLKEMERQTHHAMVAQVDVADSAGRKDTLRPEVHFYRQKPDQPVYKVAVGLGLGQDVYVRLLGTDDSGSWAIQVIRNPLVNWIWIGGTLLTIGGAICLVPTGRKTAAEAQHYDQGVSDDTENAQRTGRKKR